MHDRKKPAGEKKERDSEKEREEVKGQYFHLVIRVSCQRCV